MVSLVQVAELPTTCHLGHPQVSTVSVMSSYPLLKTFEEEQSRLADGIEANRVALEDMDVKLELMRAQSYCRLKSKYPSYFPARWVFRDAGGDVILIHRSLLHYAHSTFHFDIAPLYPVLPTLSLRRSHERPS